MKVLEPRLIPVSEMAANDWNPNKMGELVFNALADSIEELGFGENVQLMPVDLMPAAFRASVDGDVRYVIINGEHRWKAVCVLDPDASIPAVVWGEDLVENGMSETEREQALLKLKAITSRMTLLHGGVDPDSFTQLYDEVVKGLGKSEAHRQMGITSDKVLQQHVHRAAAGLPEEIANRVKDAAKRLRNVDDLSAMLGTLMEKYGSDLDHSFMFFTFGKRVHLMVELRGNEDVKLLRRLAEYVRSGGLDMAELLCDSILGLLDGGSDGQA